MTTATRKPTISTAAYVRAHGKEPRGHGAWWFSAVSADTGSVYGTVSVTDTYARARTIARHQLAVLADGRPYDMEVLS